MRKYLIGGIAGLLMGLTFSVHAEDVKTVIGQAVQGVFPVKVEGNPLESPAIVVDNKTYLPVRSFGEALGYTVGFDAELGVSLTKSVTDEVYMNDKVRLDRIESLNKVIDSQKESTLRLEKAIQHSIEIKEDPSGFRSQLVETKSRIEKLESQLSELTGK